MNQSRRFSLIEACTSTAFGFIFSILAGMVVYPLFGHAFSLQQNLGIVLIFTLLSVVRSYVVRRVFNALQKLQERAQ